MSFIILSTLHSICLFKKKNSIYFITLIKIILYNNEIILADPFKAQRGFSEAGKGNETLNIWYDREEKRRACFVGTL